MPEQALPHLKGKDIVDLVNIKLGGTANAHQAKILPLINEAKDKVRTVVSALREGYFAVFSQSTDASTPDTYFPPLNTTTREYTLPYGCIRIINIIVTTSGYETLEFKYRHPSADDFRQSRRDATNNPTTSPANQGSDYLYTLLGNRQFVLDRYPEAALTLQVWYERALPNISLDGEIPELLAPFAGRISDYVVATLTLADNRTSFAGWEKRWERSLREIEAEAKQRELGDIQVANEFNESR